MQILTGRPTNSIKALKAAAKVNCEMQISKQSQRTTMKQKCECAEVKVSNGNGYLITAGNMIDDLNGTIALIARQLVANRPVRHGSLWAVASLHAVDGFACWALQSTVLAERQVVT